jgi:hypothetical protein
MKTFPYSSAIACFSLGVLMLSTCGCSGEPRESAADADARAGAIVTLRWADDLESSYCFSRRGFSLAVKGQELRSYGAHISFHRWVKDALVVGLHGKGVIKDLGDVRTKRTQSCVLPFLERRGSTVVDTSTEGSSLAGAGMPIADAAASLAAAPAALGHLYVVRIDEETGSLFAALRVVELVPDQSVTFRWRLL